MTTSTRYHAARLLGLVVALCALSGCGGSQRDELDILPDQDKARATLEKALNAWKSGQKAGRIQGESPAIEVLDSVWKNGARLTAFEILQPVDKSGPNGPGPRWFAVKLTLQDSEPQRVNYAVLGLDPLQVFREVDYNRMCGME
jgi:hypothetical protein